MKIKFFTAKKIMPKALLLLLPVLLFSCSTQNAFQYKDMVEMNKKISGSYQNTTISEYNRETKLSSFFDLKQNDSIVEINSMKNKVVVSFIDGLGTKHYKAFQGKFRRKFFQFYLKYDTILVPPLFMTIQKEQVRLSIDKDSNLVINSDQENSGMLLIFGAGHSGGGKYTFIKNN